ncbi:sirohydrochlorin ferrochelatase chloroplastic [Prunus yedoensis var. nudiflora]|uniref:Sirohydrochlorin ferrochelatase chloroplastic n=1 Tax=Prunus yedoensis var. nudiflora TaxID=2094558 RepID=A0A314UDH7_PRUYE|nr:sirohydrochlorin ferrochelatase chloroplastic [Prunus yedoensis var. nudiflora]
MGSGKGGFGQNPNGFGDRDGVIILDHGSRRKESNLMLNEFVSMFKERTGYPTELAEPSIHVAFNSNRVNDIPSLTAEAAKAASWCLIYSNRTSWPASRGMTMEFPLFDSLPMHQTASSHNFPKLWLKINHCLSHIPGDAEECSVCVGTNKCQLH